MKDSVVYSVVFHLALVVVLFICIPLSDFKTKEQKRPPIKVKVIKASSINLSTQGHLAKKIDQDKPVKQITVTKKVAMPKAPIKKVVTPKTPVKKPVTPKTVSKKTVVRKTYTPDFGMSLTDRVQNEWKNKKDKNAVAPVTEKKPLQLARVLTDDSLPTLPELTNLPELTQIDYSVPELDIPSSLPIEEVSLVSLPGMRTTGFVSAGDRWYLSQVKARLNELWIRPSRIVNDEETCTIAFTILRSGEVRNGRVSSTSGNNAFDDSVFTALTRIDSFGNLPEGIGKDSGETFFLTFLLTR